MCHLKILLDFGSHHQALHDTSYFTLFCQDKISLPKFHLCKVSDKFHMWLVHSTQCVLLHSVYNSASLYTVHHGTQCTPVQQCTICPHSVLEVVTTQEASSRKEVQEAGEGGEAGRDTDTTWSVCFTSLFWMSNIKIFYSRRAAIYTLIAIAI